MLVVSARSGHIHHTGTLIGENAQEREVGRIQFALSDITSGKDLLLHLLVDLFSIMKRESIGDLFGVNQRDPPPFPSTLLVYSSMGHKKNARINKRVPPSRDFVIVKKGGRG